MPSAFARISHFALELFFGAKISRCLLLYLNHAPFNLFNICIIEISKKYEFIKIFKFKSLFTYYFHFFLLLSFLFFFISFTFSCFFFFLNQT